MLEEEEYELVINGDESDTDDYAGDELNIDGDDDDF
jgi:hypothetical protein